jgi:hypothetical protein
VGGGVFAEFFALEVSFSLLAGFGLRGGVRGVVTLPRMLSSVQNPVSSIPRYWEVDLRCL